MERNLNGSSASSVAFCGFYVAYPGDASIDGLRLQLDGGAKEIARDEWGSKILHGVSKISFWKRRLNIILAQFTRDKNVSKETVSKETVPKDETEVVNLRSL